jgi:hypothetical protein
MKHLLVNKHCDSKYPITWVAKNIKTCRIDREYKERHESTYNGVSISVQLPDSELWAEFAANEEGWMYVSDHNARGLQVVAIEQGILEVEKNTDRTVAEMMADSRRMVEEMEANL